jgi:formate-dependent nitrite reductase membrane component NrfD
MLAVQAVIAGAATMILIGGAAPVLPRLFGGQADPLGRALTHALDAILGAGILLNLLMVLGQVRLPAYNADARRAIDAMTHGTLGRLFWYGVVIIGSAIPLLLIGVQLESGTGGEMAVISAAILALGGLFCFDEVWIKAGQAPPLS